MITSPLPLPLLPVIAPEGDAIPPVVHQVWVGSSPPSWVQAAARRWEAACADAGFTHRFWTDRSIEGTPLSRIAAVVSDVLPPRGVADVLRAYAVGWYGGWYFDIDLVPLRPLPTSVPAMIYSDASYPNRVASNGAFGFTAGHPFPAAVVEHGQRALRRGVTNEHFVCGPRAFHAAWYPDCSIPFSPTISTRCTNAQRRTQADGGDFDVEQLREQHPESTVTHIGLPR